MSIDPRGEGRLAQEPFDAPDAVPIPDSGLGIHPIYGLFSSSDRRNFGHLEPQAFVDAVLNAVREHAERSIDEAATDEAADYRDAFKAVCADMGAITALLGFEGFPKIDDTLRAITKLMARAAPGAAQ